MSDVASIDQMRHGVLHQLEFARRYTLELIESVPADQWLVTPDGCPTHLTWQVGHLAVTEYGLLLFRLRGRAESDLELVPGWFRKRYGRSSQPSSATDQLGRDAMLERLATIHEAGMEEVRRASPEQLMEPCELPYAGPATKLGSLLFAPMHEMIHAGQIGLLRRMLGLPSVR